MSLAEVLDMFGQFEVLRRLEVSSGPIQFIGRE